jgi:hypothetical protein
VIENPMKRVAAISFGLILLLMTSFAVPLISGTTTEWSSEISVKTYHWMAEKSELRDLETNERYIYGLGGLNIPDGDNAISIKSTPSNLFDIFAGDRLDLSYVVEGDMVMPPDINNDLHLLFLPLTINGTSTFELLFSERNTLENLTQCVFVNSTIETDRVIATLKYNDIHDVVYEWDTSTGLLLKKEVTAPSGLQLLVIPGRGIGFFALSPDPIVLTTISLAVLFVIFLLFRLIRRR